MGLLLCLKHSPREFKGLTIKSIDIKIATEKGITLEAYYIENIKLWQNTIKNLATAQTYENRSAVGSAVKLDRISLKDAMFQLRLWEKKYIAEYGNNDDILTSGSAEMIRIHTV